jgi:hypothetical protein
MGNDKSPKMPPPRIGRLDYLLMTSSNLETLVTAVPPDVRVPREVSFYRAYS